MQDIIKKYFWVIGLFAMLICVGLAAKATNHVIAGKYLNARAEPVKIEHKRSRAPSATQTTRSKAGAPLAERNMFCSSCAPEEVVPESTQEPGDPNVVPLTSLPLELVATNVSTRSEYSFATILNTETQSQGAYWVSNIIPNGGEVVAIARGHVDFRNQSSQRLERISLFETAKATRSRSRSESPVTVAKSETKDEMTAMLDEGIKKTGENSYEVDRALIDKVLANPMSVARGARVVPSIKDGKANGFKLYAIRPSSVFAKIGLRNGDTINSINGFELTTPDKALEVYTKVKESSNLSVSVTRRGATVNLDYTIR